MKQRPAETCPTCNGTGKGDGLVGLCLRTDAGSHGPCVMRAGHNGPCWGENDVASDWRPALPSRCETCDGGGWRWVP